MNFKYLIALLFLLQWTNCQQKIVSREDDVLDFSRLDLNQNGLLEFE